MQYVLKIPVFHCSMSSVNFCATLLFPLNSVKTKESTKVNTILVLRLEFNVKLRLSGITANFCRNLENLQNSVRSTADNRSRKYLAYVQLGFAEYRSGI
jgi:hypothetical protein